MSSKIGNVIGFYGDIPHELRRITGFRVTLTCKVFVKETTDSVSPYLPREEAMANAFRLVIEQGHLPFGCCLKHIP